MIVGGVLEITFRKSIARINRHSLLSLWGSLGRNTARQLTPGQAVFGGVLMLFFGSELVIRSLLP